MSRRRGSIPWGRRRTQVPVRADGHIPSDGKHCTRGRFKPLGLISGGAAERKRLGRFKVAEKPELSNSRVVCTTVLYGSPTAIENTKVRSWDNSGRHGRFRRKPDMATA